MSGAECRAPGDGTGPFRAPEASPRFATPLAVAAFLFAGVTLASGLAPITGPAGMAMGLVAHVKGSRLGIPSAITSGIALVASMALATYLR